MIELLENLDVWQWWIFAGVLVVVETLLPSGILYGVAFAAFVVGAAIAAPNVDVLEAWQAQVGAFAGMAVLFGWIGRGLRNPKLAPRAADAEIDSRPSMPLKPPAPTSSPGQPQAAPAAKPAAKTAPAPAKAKPAPKPAQAPATKKPPLELKKPAPAAPKPAAKPVVKPVAEKPAPAKKPAPAAAPAEPPSELIGGVYTIWTAVAGGTGSIKIKGKDYALVGPDMAAGSRVKVVAVKEKILKVEPAD